MSQTVSKEISHQQPERAIAPASDSSPRSGSRLSRSSVIYVAALLGFAVLIAKSIYFLRLIPQNYDEAYFLDVVQALLEGKASPLFAPLFHPQITTGATVTLPMFWLSQALGFSVARARLVIFAYQAIVLAVLIGMSYRLTRSRLVALCAGASLFAVPFYHDLGTIVLGEVPAYAFLLLSGTCLLRHSRFANAHTTALTRDWSLAAAGLLYGLAFVTKYQMIAVLPGFLAEIFLCSLIPNSTTDQPLTKRLLRLPISLFIFLAAAAVAPLTFFYAMVSTIGITGTSEYFTYLAVFSGHTKLRALDSMLARTGLIANWLALPLLAWSLSVALVPRSVMGLVSRPFRLFTVLWFGWFAWWCMFSATEWGRHLFPGLLIFSTTCFSALLCWHIQNKQTLHNWTWGVNRHSLSLVLVLLPVAVGLFQFLSLDLSRTDYSLSLPGEPLIKSAPVGTYAEWRDAELDAAAFVQSLPPEYNICSTGFMRDFKIEVRLKRRFCTIDLSEIGPDSPPTVVIYNRFEQVYFPAEHVARRHAEHAARATKQVEIGGYLFYFFNTQEPIT